jgi:hypothetical protein
MIEVAKKLDGKRCLMVIDDVWRLQDLKPFLHGAAAATSRAGFSAWRSAPRPTSAAGSTSAR